MLLFRPLKQFDLLFLCIFLKRNCNISPLLFNYIQQIYKRVVQGFNLPFQWCTKMFKLKLNRKSKEMRTRNKGNTKGEFCIWHRNKSLFRIWHWKFWISLSSINLKNYSVYGASVHLAIHPFVDLHDHVSFSG